MCLCHQGRWRGDVQGSSAVTQGWFHSVAIQWPLLLFFCCTTEMWKDLRVLQSSSNSLLLNIGIKPPVQQDEGAVTQLDGGKFVRKEVLELVFYNFELFYYKI